MTGTSAALAASLCEVLGEAAAALTEANGELTLELDGAQLLPAGRLLRDHERLHFEQLLDVCGVDYLEYGAGHPGGPGALKRPAARFAAVYHLLSVRHNRRLRLRVAAAGEPPTVASVNGIWPSANWYEREAFDLYGIVFEGHPDLRRLLTDYGFVGYPFRKDFPLIGQVEMRYDPQRRRVVYEPVSIEPRVLVPRVIRDAQGSAGVAGGRKPGATGEGFGA